MNKSLTHVGLLASETNTKVETLTRDAHFTDLENWLDPPKASTNFNTALDLRNPGSGQWLLDSKTYKDWKQEPNSSLWLSGIPGCGKTTLNATVVADLESSSRCYPGLLYFYFDFSEKKKQSFKSALRSLIFQLYNKVEQSRGYLDRLRDEARSNASLQASIKSLRAAFSQMAEKSGELWIVVDALDECVDVEGQKRLLSWIEDLRRSRVNIHLLVTSRRECDIEISMEKMVRRPVEVRIENYIMDDIREYVQRRVREGDGLDRWKSRPDVQQEIETTLIQKADGM